MSDKFTLDVGQANELKLAFRRCGWINADVKKITKGDMLVKILLFVRGDARIISGYFIDGDADPSIPEGICDQYTIKEHIKTGLFKWNPTKIRLHASKYKLGGYEDFTGKKHLKEIRGLPDVAANANLLDWLLAHKELIPNDWSRVYFWGTILRNRDGWLGVRYLKRDFPDAVPYCSIDWLVDDPDRYTFKGQGDAAIFCK